MIESETIHDDAASLPPTGGAGEGALPLDAVLGGVNLSGEESLADDPDVLKVELGEFDGPLDLLLRLAREQKVDLSHISISKLADQYLAYITTVRRLRLDLAADYLVMAAWLAYLKSRLLIPAPPEEKPSAEEMAAALAFQLKRLEAMQKAANDLFDLRILGRDWFRPGGAVKAANDQRKPKALEASPKEWEISLYELLRAMGAPLQRNEGQKTYELPKLELFSIEAAVSRLRSMLGHLPDWQRLESFMPVVTSGSKLARRSAMASALVASLELAKAGAVSIRQEQGFGPIYVKRLVDDLSTIEVELTSEGAA